MTRISSAYSPAAERDEPAPLPRGRRRTELLMLIFAVAVVLLAYASVGYGLNGKPPKGLLVYGLSFAALVFAAHLAVRRLAPWADPLLLPLAALLNGLGIVMIYRLQESGRDGNPGNVIAELAVRPQVVAAHQDRARAQSHPGTQDAVGADVGRWVNPSRAGDDRARMDAAWVLLRREEGRK